MQMLSRIYSSLVTLASNLKGGCSIKTYLIIACSNNWLPTRFLTLLHSLDLKLYSSARSHCHNYSVKFPVDWVTTYYLAMIIPKHVFRTILNSLQFSYQQSIYPIRTSQSDHPRHDKFYVLLHSVQT